MRFCEVCLQRLSLQGGKGYKTVLFAGVLERDVVLVWYILHIIPLSCIL